MGIFRYSDGVLPNTLAFTYALGGYLTGFWLITRPDLWLNLPGVLLLGHSMVIAAYLLHECAHNTVFRDNALNARVGSLLNWIAGSSYNSYEILRRKHFRHHVDRADVVAFDFRPQLARYPRFVKLIEALEWAYIPAADLFMHAMILVVPFVLPSRRTERARVLWVLAVRASVFALIAWHAPRVLLLYPLAWMLMLHVLRFMDAFQHTFTLFDTLEQGSAANPAKYDAAYEFRNTFTNIHSVKYPWLNLVTLNFGYHNAHHEKPAEPWHRLPALHAQLYGDTCSQILPFTNLLAAYHRYRTQRLLNADPDDLDVLSDQGKSFIGVDGVSFLTGH